MQGAAVSEYFHRDRLREGWSAEAGLVEGRPAVLLRIGPDPTAGPDSFILLDWLDERVVAIRDFLFVPYVIDAADTAAS